MSELTKAFDISAFKNDSHGLVDLLHEHLKASIARSDHRVFSWEDPEQQYGFWKQFEGNQDSMALFRAVLDRSLHLHHPRYMGHQASPPVPTAALAGFFNGLLNNLPGIYEMGAPAVAMERWVVEKTAAAMGFSQGADGILTSGGSLGNLTALLTARANMQQDHWQAGNTTPLALMVSEQAHYCVDRAVRIMGWGEEGIIKIPVDHQFRMRTELLEEAWEEAQAAGRRVIAVVGSACSTATGAFDDLPAIADFCAQKEIWFHVDGAHGASAVFSDQYRHLVEGIQLADSVVLDYHKSMMIPALATAVIYKQGRDAYRTFAQKASYLWQADDGTEWFNLARRTFETTKASISLTVFAVWSKYGNGLFQDYVNHTYHNSRCLAGLIQQHPRFSLAVEPASNIVCFRYHPPHLGEADLDDLNQEIRQTMLAEGRFYMVQARLNGKTHLRVSLTNPPTEEEDLVDLLATVEKVAQRLSIPAIAN